MITADQARAHAELCGALLPLCFAFPVGPDADLNPEWVTLAHPLCHPGTGDEICPVGQRMSAENLAYVAAEYGFDYVVAVSIPTEGLPLPRIYIDDGNETDSWMGSLDGQSLPKSKVFSDNEREPATAALQSLERAQVGAIYMVGYVMRDTTEPARSWTFVKVDESSWVEH